MSANGISTLATKQLKQEGKLAIAQLKRRGYQVSSTNGSVLFNGTSQYLTTSNTGLNLTGNFTVEGWFYPTNVTGAHALWTFGQASAGRYTVQLNGTALLTNLYGAGSTNYTSTVPINTWTHIAMVRSGTTVKIYINGTASVTTDTQSGTIGNGGYLNIGVDDSGGALFTGNISNFRVVKGTALYTATFTPDQGKLPLVPNTSLLLNTVYGSNFLFDYSTNALTVSNVGTATSSSFSPTTTNTADTSANFYRIGNTYDITELPTKYSGNTLIDNPNPDGLIPGHPWIPGNFVAGLALTQYPQYFGKNVAGPPGTDHVDFTTNTNLNQVYTSLAFNYGEAKISFTLTPTGEFINVSCPDGAGGYPYGPTVDPVLLMPGNQLLGGTSPANDIYWEYSQNSTPGVITGFTYRSGTPPLPPVATAATILSDSEVATNTSWQFIGYFHPQTTETYTFYLDTDDAGYMWIGNNAKSGFTYTNAFINNGGTHGSGAPVSNTISLTAGGYYPVRLVYGNLSGAGVFDLQFSTPTIAKSGNFTGLITYNTYTTGL